MGKLAENMQARCANSFQRDLFSVSQGIQKSRIRRYADIDEKIKNRIISFSMLNWNLFILKVTKQSYLNYNEKQNSCSREPLMWVPYGKTVHRTVLPTLLHFQSNFFLGSAQTRKPLKRLERNFLSPSR